MIDSKIKDMARDLRVLRWLLVAMIFSAAMVGLISLFSLYVLHMQASENRVQAISITNLKKKDVELSLRIEALEAENDHGSDQDLPASSKR